MTPDDGCTDRRQANALRDAQLQERVRKFMAEEDDRHAKVDQTVRNIETGVFELSHGTWRAKLAGIETKTVLLAFILLACVAFFWYVTAEGRRLDSEARADYLAQHKTTQAMLQSVIVNQRAILQSITEAKAQGSEQASEFTYVLTLPQAKRDALKLEMPYSLRKRLSERP